MKNNAKIRTAALALAVIFIPAIIIYSAAGADMNKAAKLYIDKCSNCHRKTGKGISKVYPPVKNSDYIKNAGTSELLRGILFGRSGTLKVNGIIYNGVMTTEIDASLSDDDIALILTYIYQQMNDMNITVTAKDVKAARKAGKLPPHND